MPPSLPPPSKKRKVQESKKVKEIQHLEQVLTDAISSNTSLNPLADLVDLASKASDPQDCSKAIYALYRVFVLLFGQRKLEVDGGEAAAAVKTWIRDQMNRYVNVVGALLRHEEKVLRTSALQILFSLQKHLSSSISAPSKPQFHVSHFKKIVSFLLLAPPEHSAPLDPDVLQEFHEKWFSENDDIRWFFLREAATLLNTHADDNELPANLLPSSSALRPFPLNRPSSIPDDDSDEEEKPAGGDEDDDDWRKFFDDEPAAKDAKTPAVSARLHNMTIHQSLHSLSSHRAVFTRAWLTLLPRLTVRDDPETSRALAVRALNVMHRGVLPHLTRAVLVMDWIAACVDYGGSPGLLALNALFVLMKEYNLDYPFFYTRLYAFLDRDVLHLKHRARFFRMTELFLSSTDPTGVIHQAPCAAVAQRPPAAIVMVIPFTYNILKRHPKLMPMIHRTDHDGAEQDPFLTGEPDPQLTHALASSLWELATHREHYHAGVSTLAKIFSEAFTKPSYAMEDFLDHTYGTLFETEVKRRIKKEPALAIELGKNLDGLFPVVQEDRPPLEGGIVQDLWVFA
ncbi:CBF/Mak21 family-domain-containing protein [Schizophyllum amplum]|uniref:CBF/Mak21 family-domain-containing protein n=1 Tax=Schizophyllum amplum TaxID=97359 RepID=A0A550CBX3_9AGAR|nr:CBF/Mak21 family-domain-containing protein [Auriculariopsis ampla]